VQEDDVEPNRGRMRPGLVLPVRTSPDGPTKKQVRGPGFRRTSRGFYVPAWVDAENVEQRIAEASVLVPAAKGAISGWAALRWWGGSWFSGTDGRGERLPIPIVISTFDIRPQAGIRISGEACPPKHRRWLDAVPVTDPCWSVSFEMRYARDERAAAVVLDMACYDDLVSLAEMEDFLATQNSWTGIPQARAGLRLAVENSWSPWESKARLMWQLDAGLPQPLCNPPIFTSAGKHLGTPDLLDPDSGLLGQYDSSLHVTTGARTRDIDRDALFRAHGLEPVIITSADVVDPARFLARVRQARERAAANPRPPTWTLEPPPWWISTRTVEQRRALTESQRARLLRYRNRA